MNKPRIFLRHGGNSYAADVRVVAAKAWLKEGLHDEARAHLEQALTFYGFVGATWFVREINSLLASIKHEQNGIAESHIRRALCRAIHGRQA
jgi:hypothetical protein